MSDRDTGAAHARPLIRCGEGEIIERYSSSRPGSLPWLELELPAPPSVNRFISRLGNKTPVVQRWIRQADMAFTMERARRPLTQIKCAYEAQYIFGPHTGDLSNRVKPLEDWLQRVGIIENDRHCRKFVCEWAADLGLDVPKGRVLVKLRPFMTTEGK